MKKTILATMTVAAALMASAPFAKANAFLELISGSTTTVTALGNSAFYGGSIGSWDVSVTFGSSSGTPTLLNVGLNTSDNGNFVTKGLTIIYSSGSYPIYGNYSFSATFDHDSLGASAAVYRDVGLYPGSPVSYGTQLGSTLSSAANVNLALSYNEAGYIGQPPYYLNEVINIGGGGSATFSGAYQHEQVTSAFRVTPVPDGGLTLAMLGSALIGVAGIRSKFGKRA